MQERSVNLPVGWDLHQARLCAANERLHPRLCLSLVVDLRPVVTQAQIIRLRAEDTTLVERPNLQANQYPLVGHVRMIYPTP